MADRDLRGVERAAILVSALGENAAAEVFRYMEPRDIHSIASAMAKMPKVSRTTLSIVLNEFCSSIKNETGIAVSADKFLKSVLPKALGSEKAENIIERIYIDSNNNGLESLKWMEPRAVAEIIGLEHPQVIAIILSCFSSEHSADVLEYLPDETRVDVLVRLATLESIHPSALKELNNIVEKQFSHGIKNEINSTNIDGLMRAADILKHSDVSIENEIIDIINEENPDLGQRIMDAMFIFEDLIDLEDKDIQTILREITSESLVVALKGSDDALKEKIFSNMSKRAGRMLSEDMEDRGSVRLREVEYAKKEILLVARRLAAAGDISLGKPGSTIYV